MINWIICIAIYFAVMIAIQIWDAYIGFGDDFDRYFKIREIMIFWPVAAIMFATICPILWYADLIEKAKAKRLLNKK